MYMITAGQVVKAATDIVNTHEKYATPQMRNFLHVKMRSVSSKVMELLSFIVFVMHRRLDFNTEKFLHNESLWNSISYTDLIFLHNGDYAKLK
jgi:hypothetical protein